MNVKPLMMFFGTLLSCSALVAQKDAVGWEPEEGQNSPEGIFLSFIAMAGFIAILFLLRRLTERRRYSDRFHSIDLHELATGPIGYGRSAVPTPQFALVAEWDYARVVTVLLSFVIAALLYYASSPWINAEWLLS